MGRGTGNSRLPPLIAVVDEVVVHAATVMVDSASRACSMEPARLGAAITGVAEIYDLDAHWAVDRRDRGRARAAAYGDGACGPRQHPRRHGRRPCPQKGRGSQGRDVLNGLGTVGARMGSARSDLPQGIDLGLETHARYSSVWPVCV